MKVNKKFLTDESKKRAGKNVPKGMLYSKREDAHFFFGEKVFTTQDDTKSVRGYVGKNQDVDGHVLVIGGAGSGKSTCVAIPTLRNWGGTFFAIDIKGELSDTYRHELFNGRPTKILNLSKEGGVSSSYDPFYFMRNSDEADLVQNAREIAHAIIPMPPNVLEPFWTLAAQHVLTAALLYGFGMKATDENGKIVEKGEVLEASFNQTLTLIQSMPIWKLIDRIEKSNNDVAKMHITQFTQICDPSDSKMLAGISAELSNKIMVFSSDLRIKDLFEPSANMLTWEDLETHNIFMRIAEDKLGQWDGAITLMLTQLIRTLERRPDKKYDPDGMKKNLPSVLLLLDEFPRLGKVDVIQNAVATLRSKGVTICLMMQSLAQLDRTYGKVTRQVIVDNCQYKAILNVTDSENQKIFSDMVGTIKVPTRSTSKSRSKNKSKNKSKNLDENDESTSRSDGKSWGSSQGVSYSTSETREPVIHPHEFATLKDIVLLTPDGFCRVEKTPYFMMPDFQQLKSKTNDYSKGMDIQKFRKTIKNGRSPQ